VRYCRATEEEAATPSLFDILDAQEATDPRQAAGGEMVTAPEDWIDTQEEDEAEEHEGLFETL